MLLDPHPANPFFFLFFCYLYFLVCLFILPDILHIYPLVLTLIYYKFLLSFSPHTGECQHALLCYGHSPSTPAASCLSMFFSVFSLVFFSSPLFLLIPCFLLVWFSFLILCCVCFFTPPDGKKHPQGGEAHTCPFYYIHTPASLSSSPCPGTAHPHTHFLPTERARPTAPGAARPRRLVSLALNAPPASPSSAILADVPNPGLFSVPPPLQHYPAW